jgi:hypothetical protein
LTPFKNGIGAVYARLGVRSCLRNVAWRRPVPTVRTTFGEEATRMPIGLAAPAE